MTLWFGPLDLGTTAASSPAVSPLTGMPVRSWGQCARTHNHPDLVVHRFIHNPQPLLSLLKDPYFVQRKGKSPQ